MPIANSQPEDAPASQRKRWMQACAQARSSELAAFISEFGSDEAFSPVRGPETGLVMVRGRIGGGGSPFNLGEATMSRATIRLSSGEIGHGQRLGSDRELARLSAIIDALAQRPQLADAIDLWVSSVEARLAAEAAVVAAETAATKVDFFTLVRGED